MPKELKIILSCFFILAIITFWIVIKTNQTTAVSTPVVGIKGDDKVDQLGNVPRLGGLIVKEYSFTNTTDKLVKLGRLTTSCMCTKAKVVIGSQESALYGMESSGDLNTPLNFELKPGESGKVVVNFDPNAHGPKGVGPFDRVIRLYFADPQSLKEFKFSGTII